MKHASAAQPGLRIVVLCTLLALMLAFLCSCGLMREDSFTQADGIELVPGQDYAFDVEDLGTDYTWKSDDEGIAIVDENGQIVALRPGETYITVTVDGREHRMRVSVKDDGAHEADEAATAELLNGQRDAAIDKVPLQNTIVLYGGDVEAKPGEKDVTLALFVERNPGILGMTLTIHFDDTALRLASAANGDAVKNILTMTKAKTLKDGCAFTWDGTDVESYQAYDGAVLVLKFDVSEDAKPGVYPVDFTYEYGDVVNGKLVPLDVDIMGGSITVK